MNKDIKSVIERIKRYSQTPSLSGHETGMFAHIDNSFPDWNHLVERRKDCLYFHSKKPASYLVTVHIDRIPVKPFEFRVEEEKGLLHGQLDNAISLAIAHVIAEKEYPFDYLFTSNEERLGSADQITGVVKEYYSGIANNINVLDLDIDVAIDYKEIERGAISLRDRDSIVEYDKELVNDLREIAQINNVAYDTKDGHWLMCQIGTAIEAEPKLHGCYFGLPIWQYHSNKEIINFKCIDNALKLFKALAKE